MVEPGTDRKAAVRGAFLVTRPEPEAAALAAMIRARGSFEVFAAPMTRIVPAPLSEALPSADMLLLTSPRAARLAPRLPLPVVAVGETTAAAARAAGFEVIRAGSGQVDSALLGAFPRGARVLHLAGAAISQPLEAPMKARGVTYERRTLYRAEPIIAAPAALKDFLRQSGPHLVSFFSQGAITGFAKAAAALAVPPLNVLAASERVAEALPNTLPYAKVMIVGSADPAAFVDFAELHCT